MLETWSRMNKCEINSSNSSISIFIRFNVDIDVVQSNWNWLRAVAENIKSSSDIYFAATVKRSTRNHNAAKKRGIKKSRRSIDFAFLNKTKNTFKQIKSERIKRLRHRISFIGVSVRFISRLIRGSSWNVSYFSVSPFSWPFAAQLRCSIEFSIWHHIRIENDIFVVCEWQNTTRKNWTAIKSN